MRDLGVSRSGVKLAGESKVQTTMSARPWFGLPWGTAVATVLTLSEARVANSAARPKPASILGWLPRGGGAMAAFCTALLVGVIDWLTGPNVSVSILYLVPISAAAFYAGRPLAFSLCAFSALLALGLDFVTGSAQVNPWILVWNGLVRLGLFLLVVWLVSRMRRLIIDLNVLVQHRTAELETEMRRRKALESEAVEVCHLENQRIAHELHDNLGANLAGVAFRLKTAVEKLQDRGAVEATECREALAAVNGTIAQVRGFARLLDPAEGGAGSLSLALIQLGAEIERVFGVPCATQVTSPLPELSAEQQRHLYCIAREAVRNAVQHAAARNVSVQVRLQDNVLALIVRNDGRCWEPPDQANSGLGLRIMHHRTEMMHGTLSIGAGEGGGAVLSCRVPVPQPKADA
jgi:signal transduction histidine kinase